MSKEHLKSGEIQKKSKGGGRSISYPAITLETAISRAEQLYNSENTHFVPIESAISCWGYSNKSSGGMLTVSALLNFGLIVAEGSGTSRKIKISDRVIKIIYAPDENTRRTSIKEALYSPKIYNELLKKWAHNQLPSEKTIKLFLIQDKKFNANTVDHFISDFKTNINFAQLDNSDISDNHTDNTEENMNVSPTDNEMIQKNPIPIKPEYTASSNNVMQDVFTFQEGKVLLQWPANMTEESFEDFQAWLELQMRKIKRSIKSSLGEQNK